MVKLSLILALASISALASVLSGQVSAEEMNYGMFGGGFFPPGMGMGGLPMNVPPFGTANGGFPSAINFNNMGTMAPGCRTVKTGTSISVQCSSSSSSTSPNQPGSTSATTTSPSANDNNADKSNENSSVEHGSDDNEGDIGGNEGDDKPETSIKDNNHSVPTQVPTGSGTMAPGCRTVKTGTSISVQCSSSSSSTSPNQPGSTSWSTSTSTSTGNGPVHGSRRALRG